MASEKTQLLLPSGKHDTPAPDIGFAPADEKHEKISMVPFKQLFCFRDNVDVILMILGTFGSIAYGVLTPTQFILMGSVTDDFVDFVQCLRTNCTNPVDLEDSMTSVCLWYVAFAFLNLLFAWMGLGLWGLTAERQVHKMRLAMFRNIIHQEIAWFDTHPSGELGTRLTEDLNKLADGIGSKFGRLIFSFSAFFAGYILGFCYLWKLALVMMAVLPIVALSGGVLAKIIGGFAAKELAAYSKAGSVAEQSISSIRTVAAFGGEAEQTKKYDIHLTKSCKFGINKGFGIGIGMGIFQVTTLGNYAFSLWYGVRLIRDGDAEPGDVASVFYMVMLGSVMVGQGAPCMEALAAARGVGYTIFNIIERNSAIDPSSAAGMKPDVIGDVEFRDIDFVYPSRPTVQILKDFSLKVPHGKRIALVGESGCGKSTVVKLISRFYDPQKGSVLLDGKNIKDINVSHLRSHIGVVNQEPILFSTTIAENIAYGREGVTQQEIEKAARAANAHSFISQFPKGYETQCGERGTQMSGGQKQRIAIARALVRNPKILLLDEATSALDFESEAIVQEALDRAGEGRTTIVIAHRLSTIRNADIIVVVKEGHMAETGTHEELMAIPNGIYKTLVRFQKAVDDRSYNESDDVEDDVEEANEPFQLEEVDGVFELGSFTCSSSVDGHTKTIVTEEGEAVKPMSFFKILKYNAPEFWYIVIGCFGSALFGSNPCVYGIAIGGVFEAFTYDPKIPSEREEMEDVSVKWSMVFFALGIGSGVGIFLQNWMFAKSGEALTQRLRKWSFVAVLRQEISYFDKPKNSTGALCSRLSTEVSAVQGATGSQLGFISSSLVSVIGGLLVCFVTSWKLSLVMTSFAPLMLLSGVFFMTALGASTRGNLEEDAGKVAEETLSNIQTVASLGREEEFFERYRTAMAEPYRKAKKICHFAGLATGSTFCIVNLTFAASFRYGATLVVDYDITLKDMMTTVFTYLSVGLIAGQTSSMTPDYSKAKIAAQKVFTFIDSVPSIDNQSEEGLKPEKCKGEIKLNEVGFRYPTRRKIKVLRNLNVTVKPGQTVALVGTSGCGKSTTISLVERFYDVSSGSVTMDAHNVKDLNIKWLRHQIGIVSQEPVLFDMTIRENIAYGDTTREVSDKEIEQAARSANIHQFIASLPKGYDTMVGDKGTLISGGQKQRIAIARALVRDPKILLLDEATSALDTESEKVVQQALDNASVGRTTLTSTIHISEEGFYLTTFLYLYFEKMKIHHAICQGFHVHIDESDMISTSSLKHEKISMVPFKQLFCFRDNVDVILMILGTFGSIAYGVLAPTQFILMRSVTDDFVDFVQCLRTNCTNPVDLEDSMTSVCLWYVAFAFLNLLFAWMGLGLWGLTAERQVHKMRLAMFRNIIHQEIAWFDTHPSGELGTRLTEDLNKLADGIGSKFGRLICSFSAFIAGYILGFCYLWKMTLVMLAVLPVIALSAGLLGKIIGGFAANELAAYSKAGSVAEQSFSSIRTVAAFGGEAEQTKKVRVKTEDVCTRYDIHLTNSCKFGINKGLAVGFGLGIFQVSSLGNYALALWYGIRLVRDDEVEPGDVSSVFFMVESMKPDVIGDVEFRDIDFVYPLRPTVQILKDFSLKVPHGKRVALVGESGCGKSTVVKLISRFYDPQKGSVLLDGQNIKHLNVSHLRSHIGVVSQEPILFSTTIAENIAYGREGVTQQEIEKAAMAANAHNFISQFPKGYETLCGERGTQMSGGQKQRIAIARALVRNPKILLLDEATSALDSVSEAVVQEALDRAGEGRTTIVIAHRLSTIRNADIIVVVKEGHVTETGTHEELMAIPSGIYKTLVRFQKAKVDAHLQTFAYDPKIPSERENMEDDSYNLSIHSSRDKCATGSQLGFISSTLVSVVGGLLVSFVNSWKLSLVMTSFAPLMVMSGVFFMAALGSVTRGNLEEDAAKVAEETLSNIQTVVSLGREEEFFERYRTAMAEPYRKAKKNEKCKVLRNLNITVKPGQTVALVGTSGCGKSTTISLVERFYDVSSGSV
ncbi:multidrug resistance 1 isoform X2, partial [Paramuricea clavata]